jgi:hypothetical protein
MVSRLRRTGGLRLDLKVKAFLIVVRVGQHAPLEDKEPVRGRMRAKQGIAANPLRLMWQG